MADENQSPPDERQDQGPTPEELQAAEMAKTAQTIQLVGAMNQTVAPLPMTLPTQTDPVAPPVGAPVEPPRNRMFMGPNIGGPTNPQEFFGDLSPNRLIMPPNMRNPAPLPPDTQAAMQARLTAGTGVESDPSALARIQAADAPGSRTLAVRSESPYSDASLANQRNAMLYNAMKKFDAGDRSPDNMALLLGRTASAGKRYNVAGVGLVDENGRVITAHPYSTQTRTVQGVGLVDAKTGRVITPSVQKPETQTETETIPANPGSPGSPALAARSGFLGIGARPAIPAVAAVPATGERKITRKVPVEAPASDIANIPKASVDYLKAHPAAAKSFDQKYGKGAAAKILQE